MFPIKIHQGGPAQEERDIEQINLSKVGLEPRTSNSCGVYSTATSGSPRIKTFGLFFIHLCSKNFEVSPFAFQMFRFFETDTI